MSSTIIETTGLTRAYSPDAGIWGLDLRVPQGAIYAFLGPNGSGKTTTIRLLLGLLKADAGNILIDGEPVHVGTRPRHWIGSMVEGPSLYPRLTGRENLHIAGKLFGAGRAQVDEALQTVGLADAGNRLVKQYSLGMRQRLGIALALLGRPRLLILDEPSNGLDPPGMADMRALMKMLVRERGMTVFLSSHLLDDVEKIATHLGLLHRGRLLAQGELAAMREQHVRIVCNDAVQAMQLLGAAGYQVKPGAENALLVQTPADAAAQINRLLVMAGIEVNQLAAERDSLEQFFAVMTGEQGAA